MTRRFSIFSRPAPAASRAHRSHCTCWSSVSASATSPTRSSRLSLLITHLAIPPRSRRPPGKCCPGAQTSRQRPARGPRIRFPLLSSYDVWMARTGQLPHGWVNSPSRRGRRYGGTLPPGGLWHELAEPDQGALERLARRAGSRQAFDGREVRVVVPQVPRGRRSTGDRGPSGASTPPGSAPTSHPEGVADAAGPHRRRAAGVPRPARGGLCPDAAWRGGGR